MVGGGRQRPTLGEWTWCHCWVPSYGAIIVCYRWGGWPPPVQGAIVVCYGWRGKVTTNFGGVDVAPLLGAIVRCHCSVLWLGMVTPNFGGVDVVPAACHSSVLWFGGEGDDQLWGSGRGAIAGCKCSVLWWREGRVTANFGGGRGAIVVCYGWWGRVTTNFWGVDVMP